MKETHHSISIRHLELQGVLASLNFKAENTMSASVLGFKLKPIINTEADTVFSALADLTAA